MAARRIPSLLSRSLSAPSTSTPHFLSPRKNPGRGRGIYRFSTAAALEETITPSVQISYTQHLINGQFVDAASGKTFPAYDPRNGEVIAHVAEGDAEDVNRAVAAARKAFDEGPWPKMSAYERSLIMLRFADLVDKHRGELAALESWNSGKPNEQSAKSELPSFARLFRYYAGWADKIHGLTVPADGKHHVQTLHEPIGVAGQIIPWNFPLIMFAWKVGPALACGNTIVLKSAEQTPLTALYAAKLFQEAGLPPGVLNVVSGDGPSAGAALASHMDVDKPPGFKDATRPSHVCKLNKAIYGLKQAPRAWYTTLKTAILTLGFTQSRADPSLFIYNNNHYTCFLLVYVDDLLITGNNLQFVSSMIEQLSSRFSLKDMGNLHFFLGVEVIPHPAGLFLSQQQYIRDLLSTTNMDGAKDVSTPLSTSSILKLDDGSASVDSTEFRRVIGSLQYLSLTRPDISFAVNKLSQFMHRPTQSHWMATKRLLRYLKHTLFHGLQISNSGSPVLRTFSDADWGGNLDDRTSTSAYVTFLGTTPISWSSRKQKAVARSSTEAEYRALASAASETMWILNLLQELGFPLSSPPKLLCDNLGATHLSYNPVNHSRMKHIQIDLHFVRDLVHRGILQVHHVHTDDQLADLLTKPLSKQRTVFLRNKIGLADGSSILKGRIKEDKSAN